MPVLRGADEEGEEPAELRCAHALLGSKLLGCKLRDRDHSGKQTSGKRGHASPPKRPQETRPTRKIPAPAVWSSLTAPFLRLPGECESARRVRTFKTTATWLRGQCVDTAPTWDCTSNETNHIPFLRAPPPSWKRRWRPARPPGRRWRDRGLANPPTRHHQSPGATPQWPRPPRPQPPFGSSYGKRPEQNKATLEKH